MDFQKYAKHLRYYDNVLYDYHHKQVETNFYKILDKLGQPTGEYKAVFITLRLKGSSDWVSCNIASNALEWKLCKHYWKKKGKKMLINGTTPYIHSIETNHNRIKEHIHALLLLKDLKTDYTDDEILDDIRKIALSLDEVNSRNPEVVRLRLFPFSMDTKEEATEVGNTLEYLCKTSSKQYDPLEKQPINQTTQKRLKPL